MFNLKEINEIHLDFFKEMESIGASHAATALSTLLGRTVSLRVPNVRFYEFSNICDMLGGPENLVVGLLVEMTGDLSGFILLVQDAYDARELADAIIQSMGLPKEESSELLTPLQLSSICEVSNILSGAYLNAVSLLTGLNVNNSVPTSVIDMAGAIMNLPAVTYGEYGDVVLFLETEFIDTESNKSLNGHFMIVPDIESFSVLLKTMGLD